jgi:hypothetical protein
MGVAYRSIQLKNPTVFCNILSQREDLSQTTVCADRPNVILALAIQRDDDQDDYIEQQVIPDHRISQP